MITWRKALALGTVGVLNVAGPLFAHHAWVVHRTRAVTVKGTVTGFDWSNPHVEIFLDAQDDNGSVGKWIVRGPSTGGLVGNGWRRDTSSRET